MVGWRALAWIVVAAGFGACQADFVADGLDDSPSCDLCHGSPPKSPHPQSADCHKCHDGTVKADGSIDSGRGLHMNDEVDVAGGTCDACHGFPPPAPHPASSECHRCHGGTVGADGSINEEQGLHMNDEVDVSDLACDACHGSDASPAPPTDLSGASSPENPGVGAHQSHLAPASWHATVSCGECHVVPTALGDPGHVDTETPAEIVWGPKASADGAAPSYDYSKNTCSGVYCHGATLTGAVFADPKWTSLNQARSACGACHGVPPPPPHPEKGECSSCHSEVIGPAMQWVAPDRHMDGKLDVDN